MNKYKKALLATLVIASMPLIAATNNEPIKVTTFEDEDNENPNSCSLREALETARKRVSYGGCQVTDTSNQPKTIQLEAGVYKLNKELEPEVSVTILGASPVDWQNKNVLINDAVNQYPAPVELKTTIQATNSRIFNTTKGKQSLTLTNLILSNGSAPSGENGGAIYAGANINLLSTNIVNSKALTGSGGAIFLAGLTGDLSISKSLIQANNSLHGSVLAMTDRDDLEYIKRKIDIKSSSFVYNGANDSLSMMEFSGQPTVVLEANTIAKNNVSFTAGNLIKFSGDTKASSEPNNNTSILSKNSSIQLNSNTIVENKGYTTFLYDKLGIKLLTFNIIAYNGDVNSYACRYLLGDTNGIEKAGISIFYNAFSLSGNNKCDLPEDTFKDNKTNIDIGSVSKEKLISTLIPPSAYTAFLPIYYPKRNAKDELSLVNVSPNGVTLCSTIDQRGLPRLTDGVLYFTPDSINTCDIGSIELMRLTAGDIKDLSNSSISKLISDYKSEKEFFADLVQSPNNSDYLIYYKSRLKQYTDLVENFTNEELKKQNLKYRAIYVDLKSNKLPLPQEVEINDGDNQGAHKLDFFTPELYDIQVEDIGMGTINDVISQVNKDPNLVCKWNANLQQIMIYRKDDAITSSSEKAYCKYTITYKADNKIQSTGLLSAAFINNPPVAKDTSVTLKYQQAEKVKINLLDFANDDGDTGGGSGPENSPNKAAFWRNAEGIELPIRLSNVPIKNLLVTADRQGSCPVPDQKETCYGGNIYIQEVNNFNPFNFSFNYQVYDNDGTPKLSNLATVNVISTATTSDDTRKASNGGGSTTIFSLLGLISLLVIRRFKK